MSDKEITIKELAEGLAQFADIITERLDSIETRIESTEIRIDNVSEDMDRLTEYTLSGLETLNGRFDYLDDQFSRMESRASAIY